jgi:hypothetical protein
MPRYHYLNGIPCRQIPCAMHQSCEHAFMIGSLTPITTKLPAIHHQESNERAGFGRIQHSLMCLRWASTLPVT